MKKEEITLEKSVITLPNKNQLINKGLLGRGGFGAVYLFVDEKNSQQYAVKVPLDEAKAKDIPSEYKLNKIFSPKSTHLINISGIDILIMPYAGQENMLNFLKTRCLSESKDSNMGLILTALLSWSNELIRFRGHGYGHDDGDLDNVMYNGVEAKLIDLAGAIEFKDKKSRDDFTKDISLPLESSLAGLIQVLEMKGALSSTDAAQLEKLLKNVDELVFKQVSSDLIIQKIKVAVIELLNPQIEIKDARRIIEMFEQPRSFSLSEMFKPSLSTALLTELGRLDSKGGKTITFTHFESFLKKYSKDDDFLPKTLDTFQRTTQHMSFQAAMINNLTAEFAKPSRIAPHKESSEKNTATLGS
jgi:hypothetical protein